MSDQDAIAAAVAAAYERAAKVCDELSASYLRSGVGYDESTREGGKVCAANSCANAIRALIPEPTPQPVGPLGHEFVPWFRLDHYRSTAVEYCKECGQPRSAHTAAESTVAAKLSEIARDLAANQVPMDWPEGVKPSDLYEESPVESVAEQDEAVRDAGPTPLMGGHASGRLGLTPSATRDEERERLIARSQEHIRGWTDGLGKTWGDPASSLIRDLAAMLAAAAKRIAELEGEAAEQKKIADLAVAQCDEMTAEACRMASEIANLSVATAPDGHVLLSRRQPTAEDIEAAKAYLRRAVGEDAMMEEAIASARMASEADEDGTGSQLEEKK